jgi:hypothetical protein
VYTVSWNAAARSAMLVALPHIDRSYFLPSLPGNNHDGRQSVHGYSSAPLSYSKFLCLHFISVLTSLISTMNTFKYLSYISSEDEIICLLAFREVRISVSHNLPSDANPLPGE